MRAQRFAPLALSSAFLQGSRGQVFCNGGIARARGAVLHGHFSWPKGLLSGYGLTNLDPGRNGLGLNNILYISMLLNYFEGRVAEQKTAGPNAARGRARSTPSSAATARSPCHLPAQKRPGIHNDAQHARHVRSSALLAVVLTSTGGPEAKFTKPTEFRAGRADVADLERYLDATRSTLLYARKVLLVEGPAEQFVVPPLIKRSWVSILTRRASQLFRYMARTSPRTQSSSAPAAFRRNAQSSPMVTETFRCRSKYGGGQEQDGPLPARQDLNALRGQYVEVFTCQTTFERELTLPGTLAMLKARPGSRCPPRRRYTPAP